MPGTHFKLEVQPQIPKELCRLEELANNLIYSWDRQVRGLFFRLDKDLWESTGHNPSRFLKYISQEKLEKAAKDPAYIQDYKKTLSSYDFYLETVNPIGTEGYLNPEQDLISYSCAEFGVHESLPIYSGGLGILAGDHCKTASDLGLPFIGIGLLYRRGYFGQTIDGEGNQVVQYNPSKFAHLPITCVKNTDNCNLTISIDVPDRTIYLRVWQAQIGHIAIYLMDTDIPENTAEDRRITYQLYGGDKTNRLLQEMILGIGGVRAQRALGFSPTVWHLNEGHSSFQIIERVRELVASGENFYTALEAVAACTVFTTHTPVPAGHDIFSHELISHYFRHIVEQLGISMDEFLSLGKSPLDAKGFNMTALAFRGSRYHNGVSRIHGEVASKVEGYIWPQIDNDENPVRYVTNGIHVPTFLASEWVHYFDLQFGGNWRMELLNQDYWDRVDSIPDHAFWSRRESLKAKMLEAVRDRVINQCRRNGLSETQIKRLTKYLDPRQTDVLVLGFARRFATYKRATLIFSDEARLARLLNQKDKETIIIFAGKAHPADEPGQALIRKIYQYSRQPEFEGKIILVEDFDIALARKLVSGVDVWLNNPQYPLEASGTSGEKAAVNGVINLSVLDGWWAEGYNGENGWAIVPHGNLFSAEFRDCEEANELLDILEQEVIPLYYNRNGQGFSTDWIKLSKASMKTMMYRFNSQRMVMDYVRMFYSKAAKSGERISKNDFEVAEHLAHWKQKIHTNWPYVTIKRLDQAATRILKGDTVNIQVSVSLASLSPEDVLIDCLIGSEDENGKFKRFDCQTLSYTKQLDGEQSLFELALNPDNSGLHCYKIRIYPYHESLCQRFEMGYMLWL